MEHCFEGLRLRVKGQGLLLGCRADCLGRRGLGFGFRAYGLCEETPRLVVVRWVS